jgi:6,7-dimethyl-8-ribityllumazine synthase
MHFEYISEAVSSGLMQVGLSTSCPTIFGVLTTLDEVSAESDQHVGKYLLCACCSNTLRLNCEVLQV